MGGGAGGGGGGGGGRQQGQSCGTAVVGVSSWPTSVDRDNQMLVNRKKRRGYYSGCCTAPAAIAIGQPRPRPGQRTRHPRKKQWPPPGAHLRSARRSLFLQDFAHASAGIQVRTAVGCSGAVLVAEGAFTSLLVLGAVGASWRLRPPILAHVAILRRVTAAVVTALTAGSVI